MKVNNIEVKKVLKFPPAPAFGEYKRFFPAESVAHPAKIHTELLEYLILNYTKEGETVLDCMCGTGSTVVLSMLNNRNALGIDLEEKFITWAKRAIKNVEQQQTLTPKGKGIVICGDSRKLSELLKEHEEEINSVLFLPPYASTTISKDFKTENDLERFAKGQWVYKHGRSLEATKRFIENTWNGYPQNTDNIGNLPVDKMDSVIFSPPYKTANKGGGLNKNPPRTFRGVLKNHSFKLSDNPNNIDNLPFVDVAIFSSPYATSKAFYDLQFMDRTSKDFSDKIRKGEIKGHFMNAEARRRVFERCKEGKIENDENIGNKNKETYLSAMKTVYEQCYLVLKPQGLLILILKNFIRNKKVVKLTDHTIRLCEDVGFKLKERLLFKLPTQSFWRRLYSQKYPEVNTSDLQYEHILIFEKEGFM